MAASEPGANIHGKTMRSFVTIGEFIKGVMANSKIFLFLLTILIAMIYAGCSGVNTDSYTGDGEIIKTGKWPFSHGYLISFSEIPLNIPAKKSFEIVNFPNIGSTIYFSIMITSDEQTISNIKNGILYMSVYSESGEAYFDIRDNLSEWIFSERYISETKIESNIYYKDRTNGSYIDSEELENINRMLFSVELVGVEDNPPINGEIVMKVGGHK